MTVWISAPTRITVIAGINLVAIDVDHCLVWIDVDLL